jgi:hypothetical protein
MYLEDNKASQFSSQKNAPQSNATPCIAAQRPQCRPQCTTTMQVQFQNYLPGPNLGLPGCKKKNAKKHSRTKHSEATRVIEDILRPLLYALIIPDDPVEIR